MQRIITAAGGNPANPHAYHPERLRMKMIPALSLVAIGGHYEHGKPEGEFNPHSPVSFRRYGSWGDAPRSLAYGFRAVRSAP